MSKNFTKKRLPKSTKELSPEQLREILRKKKECNCRALRIVESLCEPNIDSAWMLNNLFFINQEHYSDIVTERAITKICGYPVCKEPLGEIPAQQYRISLKNKTVYDITERKKFCSSNCFKKSEYLKSQLLTSPLWFRDTEVQPTFHLMQTPIVEVNRTELSSQGVEEVVRDSKIECEDPGVEISDSKVDHNVGNKESNCQEIKKEKENERTSVISDPKPETAEDLIKKIEKTFEEWFTINTYVHLLGENKLREEFRGKEEIIRSFKISEPWSLRAKRFENIERLFAVLNLDGEDIEPTELRPLPDYSLLKSEADNLKIKVRAFYTGQLEVPLSAEEDSGEKLNPTGEIPLVDSHAQTALRRRVFLDRLNRVIPDVCESLELSGLVDTSDSRSLVHTFFLSAHNVTFKPREWFLISIIFIKMLSLRSPLLATRLTQPQTKTRVTLLLLSYRLPADYLDNFTDWITNVDRITSLLTS